MGLLVLCVIHAARSGNVFPWVYIIIFLPGLGAIAYILAVILPEALRSRAAGQLAANARSLADPNKSFRDSEYPGARKLSFRSARRVYSRARAACA